MSTPFAFAGFLQVPADAGLQPDAIALNASGIFDSDNREVLNLTGAGTKSVGLGTVTSVGLKALLVKVDPNPSGAPVTVIINGSNQPVEVSPGGFIALASPSPVTGITTLSVTWTTANVVRVWAMG